MADLIARMGLRPGDFVDIGGVINTPHLNGRWRVSDDGLSLVDPKPTPDTEERPIPGRRFPNG